MVQCLATSELRIVRDDLTRFLLQRVFPVQFFLGLIGNAVNLWVLTSDDATNIASDLLILLVKLLCPPNVSDTSVLAAVAVCDMMFLVMMLPHTLASFDSIAMNYSFRFFYIKSKQHVAAVANWMSAAAIWLILAISLERFLIVRSPLRSKLYWQKSRMAFVLGTVFISTGVLTVYHHFEYDCQMVAFCNGTQLFDFCYPASEIHPAGFGTHKISRPSKIIQMYMKGSAFFNAVLIVFVPIVIVVLLNIALLRLLHKADSALDISMRNASYRSQQRNRHRVTVTVIAIGICFSLTQGPSAVMVIWEQIQGYGHAGDTFYNVFSVTNSLVVTGKTLNFVLFCLSSEHFRRKCFRLFSRTFPTLSRSVSRFSRARNGSPTDPRGSIRTLRSYRRGSTRGGDLGSRQSLTQKPTQQQEGHQHNEQQGNSEEIPI